jgi:transposase
MFVDYAGQTVPVTDPRTGEICQAQVFVAVLAASNYTYAEATWTQNLWDWTHSHVRAFEFFAGTAKLIVPDNLKSGVKAPCYYEPELNRTYGDLAIHYGVGILPARPYHPRDKSKAEVGVQVVQRWVLAALRKRQFFSLAELNEAILELVHKLNERPFRKMAGSRAELYRMIDRPALHPLPACRFVYAEWKRARVNLDYHVELDQHYYSTPYQLVGKKWMSAVRAERWRSSIRASAWPVMRAAARCIRPRLRLDIGRSRTSSIWSGRRPASSNGRARLVPSRRGW